MSQQDVQIAFQAGFVTYELEDYTDGGYDIRYERFADLIRADEREACAKVCEQPIDEIQITDTISEVVYMDAHECAAVIRARGNT